MRVELLDIVKDRISERFLVIYYYRQIVLDVVILEHLRQSLTPGKLACLRLEVIDA